ncbi:MAG: lysylphosphatidylglycerol synthase domain-containing protein [Gemmatimonadota bacterium]
MKPELRFAVRFLVGAALVTLILRRVDLSGLGALTAGQAAKGVLLAAVLLLIGQGFAAFRWRLILGPGAPPWSYLYRLYVIGGFCSLFLPTVVGGDAVRAAAAARTTGAVVPVVTSVLLDRAIGVLAMFIYIGLGIAIAPNLAWRMLGGLAWSRGSGEMVAAGALTAALVAAITLTRSPRVRSAARSAREAASLLWRSPGTGALVVLIGLVVQGLYLALWVVLGWSMDLGLPLAAYAVAVPLVTLGAMLPVTLAGLGVREGVWLLLLRGLVPDARIVAFSLMFFAANLVAGSVGGVLFVTKGTSLDRQ